MASAETPYSASATSEKDKGGSKYRINMAKKKTREEIMAELLSSIRKDALSIVREIALSKKNGMRKHAIRAMLLNSVHIKNGLQRIVDEELGG